MTETKKYYSDRILKNLMDAFPNGDVKVGEREIFVVVDDIVNSMAVDNYFDNMKLYGASVDEGFVTTWDGADAIDVVDPDDGEGQSYITLPATPVALPKNGGVLEVWPLNFSKGSVKLRDHADIRRTRNLMSGGMQGQLGGYRRGNLFVFDQIGVSKNYSKKFGVRLVVKDSTAISTTGFYPIPADMKEEVIRRATLYFRERREGTPTDTVRDKVDSVKRE